MPQIRFWTIPLLASKFVWIQIDSLMDFSHWKFSFFVHAYSQFLDHVHGIYGILLLIDLFSPLFLLALDNQNVRHLQKNRSQFLYHLDRESFGLLWKLWMPKNIWGKTGAFKTLNKNISRYKCRPMLCVCISVDMRVTNCNLQHKYNSMK